MPVHAPSSAVQEGSNNPISVLFVCLGNICRSPMAEAVFRSQVRSRADIGVVDSAGTGAYHAGDPPDDRTMMVLHANGINDYSHQARKVQSDDFTNFDYILAMDKDNLANLQSTRNRLASKRGGTGERDGKIMLFGDFGGKKGEQVGDPYYGADGGFTKAYEQMVRFSMGFIEEVMGRIHQD